jgi:transducin (beta)-like 1
MSLTSTELNYLIWRYLQESGFDLAAFALEKQAHCSLFEHLANSSIVSKIGPGCLVDLVQKGILYSVVKEEVENSISAKRNESQTTPGSELGPAMNGTKQYELSLFGALIKQELQDLQVNNNITEPNRRDDQAFALKSDMADVDMADVSSSNTTNVPPVQEQPAEPIKVEFSTKKLAPLLSFDESVACDWHPSIEVFAYGKENSNAVINAMKDDTITEFVNLNHPNVLQSKNEINIVSWAPQGNLIVTAGGNGELRVWSPDGKLINIANSYNEDLVTGSPTSASIVTSLMWNDSGRFVLSIDSSMQVTLWDGTTLTLIKQIKPSVEITDNFVIDACWLSENKFAVSTTKYSIKVFSITPAPYGSSSQFDVQSIGYLQGHENVISKLKLDPKSKLLASSSDYDYKIKIWTNGLSQESLDLNANKSPEKQIKLHNSPIISLYWLNTKETSFLLSISMEGVVNVWNGSLGENVLSTELFKEQENFNFVDENLRTFSKDMLVFNSAISPNQKYLAIANDFGGVSVWDIDVENYQLNLHNKSLRCLGIYDIDIPEQGKQNVGICDLKWDSQSLKICVSYKGSSSVVVNWNS